MAIMKHMLQARLSRVWSRPSLRARTAKRGVQPESRQEAHWLEGGESFSVDAHWSGEKSQSFANPSFTGNQPPTSAPSFEGVRVIFRFVSSGSILD